MALLWLIDCGLVYSNKRAFIPNKPLGAYEDLRAFKLFVLDVGLLSCMVKLDKSVLLNGNNVYKEFKGALTEQYVLQQLKCLKSQDIYYWTNDRGSEEIDFLVEMPELILPLEVKAESNLKAKSLKSYNEKFKPSVSVRSVMVNYRKEDWVINIPLWGIEAFEKVVRSFNNN